MNSESETIVTAPETDRCQHRTFSGRCCRLPRTAPTSQFCAQHAPAPELDLDSVDLSPVLLGKIKKLTKARHMQRVLSNLFLLLAQGRITTKRASVLTYIVQQLLHTLPALDREINGNPNDVPQIIVDIPRPIRD
jgi:hypothetical protein